MSVVNSSVLDTLFYPTVIITVMWFFEEKGSGLFNLRGHLQLFYDTTRHKGDKKVSLYPSTLS